MACIALPRTHIGAGCTGYVEVIEHPVDGHQYAVKTVDKAKFEKFRNNRKTSVHHLTEVSVLHELAHRHIIQMVDWYEDAQCVYMSMAWAAGGDLLQDTMHRGRVPERIARRDCTQLCKALLYLDFRRIAHRDVKPENILLQNPSKQQRILRLIDFGLARSCERTSGCTTLCGTPMYAAPEISATENEAKISYGRNVDMWSLGVSLYVSISGLFPFQDDDTLREQVRQGRYDFNDEEWRSVSTEAMSFIRELMSINPVVRISVLCALSSTWLHTDA